MNNFKYALIFSLGAVVGSTITWAVIKKKYERIADEEIESVKNIYRKKEQALDADQKSNEFIEIETETDEVSVTEDKKNFNYNSITSGLGYSEKKEVKEEEVINEFKKPYTIAPESFGESDTGNDICYETISLTYYADGVLTYDSEDTIVEDIEGTVGLDSLKKFGEYEDDSVFVRNDNLEKDFEILRDRRCFSDVVGNLH